MLLEAGAWAVGAIGGGWHWRDAARVERERAVGGAAAQAPSTGGAERAESALLAEVGNRETVLHPYIGYVFDPALNKLPERIASKALRVDPLGFFTNDDPPPSGAPDEIEVGIFGGSVAFLLCFQAHDAVLAALAPRYPGKRLRLRCLAGGGYRQPQQLMTLAYLQSLGRHFDLVINLDGFNEVALTGPENQARRVNPFYPRGWPELVPQAPTRARLLALGTIAGLEERRVTAARWFSQRPLAWSSAATLLWRTIDRGLAARLGQARAALAATPAADRFLLRGPVYRESPDGLYADIARNWAASSRAMAALAHSTGGEYVHVLQPNQYDKGAKPMGAEERKVAVRADQPYREGVVRGYALLSREGERLREEGVTFLDARRAFADVAAPLFVDDCCHVGPEGSERLVRWIAQRLPARSDASHAAARP